MGVHGRHEQRVIENRHTAIDQSTTTDAPGRRGVVIHPEHAAGPGVERDDVVGSLRDVHDAVHDERRRREALERLRLEDPLLLEILDVRRRHLAQLGVTLAHIRAGVGEPVPRLVRGAKEALGRNLRQQGARQRRGKADRQQCGESSSSHRWPLKVRRYATTSEMSCELSVPL